MILYVETIRIHRVRINNLALHQSRMASTIRELHGPHAAVPSLLQAIRENIAVPDAGLYTCRVTYDTSIRGIDLEPYTPRTIASLRLVDAPPSLDYHLKSADRSALAALAALKGWCDDVIIVRRGLVTDTSYTNLVFRSPRGLLTPTEPLLAGTMRRHLLESGIITAHPLTPADILPGNALGITHAILINAMLPPDTAPEIPVASITV